VNATALEAMPKESNPVRYAEHVESAHLVILKLPAYSTLSSVTLTCCMFFAAVSNSFTEEVAVVLQADV